MSDESLPPDLRALDRQLGEVRFTPRASLGPELEGRLRRGEGPRGGPWPRLAAWRRRAPLVAAALVAVGLLVWVRFDRQSWPAEVIDRCCFDLDGGGLDDDGILVVAGPGEQVRRMSIYEDTDGSGAYAPGDLIRFSQTQPRR